MAVDKLVDSTQLDAGLAAVAAAIRTKGGTGAQLAFPGGFLSAIGNIETKCAYIVVTAPAGSLLTCGGQTYQLGAAETQHGFEIRVLGSYVCTAAKDGRTATQTVLVDAWTAYPIVCSPGRLPLGYTEVEYIQATGSQYIDTEIIPTNHCTEVDYYVSEYVSEGRLLGVEKYDNKFAYHFTAFNDRYYWGAGVGENNGGLWSAGRHFLKYNYGASYDVILDNVTLGTGTAISWGYGTVLLGRRSGQTKFKGRYYSVKIYEKGSDSLAADFVPCINPGNAVGMYDLVSESFFGNAGSGAFTPGPEV